MHDIHMEIRWREENDGEGLKIKQALEPIKNPRTLRGFFIDYGLFTLWRLVF